MRIGDFSVESSVYIRIVTQINELEIQCMVTLVILYKFSLENQKTKSIVFTSLDNNISITM